MKVSVGLAYKEENDKGKLVKRSKNIKAEFDGDWDNSEDHYSFRKQIREQHPDKQIMGYAPSD